MFELFILAMICLAALSLGLKIIGLFFGLIFSGFGFILRMIVFGVAAVLFFPVLLTVVGGIFSSGFLVLLIIAALCMSIIKEYRRDKRDYRYKEEYRNYSRTY